jgi:hypothetical protein
MSGKLGMEHISVLGDSWILSGSENGDGIDDEFSNILGETDTIGLTKET